MRFVSYLSNHETRLGMLDTTGENIIDLGNALDNCPVDMLDLVRHGNEVLKNIAGIDPQGVNTTPVDDVTLLAPIPRPAKNIICVGKNYPDHVNEVKSVVASTTDTKGDIPEHPIFFTKSPTSVIGNGASIPAYLDYTASVDYEGELAVVIGQGGRNIARQDALLHVFGYTVINDVTSRRLQRMHQQWFVGKSLDGFCPMGPSIVHRDAVADLSKLRIQTHVNGELRQDGVVSEMIFDIPCLIESLSRTMTLETGDIIATGTPAGVGMGFKPPKFLKKGDKVSITIDTIGTLHNYVE